MSVSTTEHCELALTKSQARACDTLTLSILLLLEIIFLLLLFPSPVPYSPTARDNSPASLVSVPCAVYPAMGIDSCVLLLLEGDGAWVPFRLFRSQFNSSACLKLGRRWLSCWEVRHHTSKREWDQHVLSILAYSEGM
jgi:hypothetical protein